MTDDTSAIQQALDKAGSAGGGVVLLPAGSAASVFVANRVNHSNVQHQWHVKGASSH